jgi:hypothetical protein
MCRDWLYQVSKTSFGIGEEAPAKNKGKNAPVTSGWWESFCDRHPNLTLRAPASLSRARATASDPAMLDRYFDLLLEVLEKMIFSIKHVKYSIWMRQACLWIRNM